jgi:hypothetical protein
MADPIWYLGPAGDMRAIVCPEPDIDITVERYGGVFQGLSGARSMTVTGHKQRFKFDFRFLTDDEFAWLEALHFRTVFGPYYRLKSPFKTNLLSPQAALIRTVGDPRTVQFTSGIAGPITDWPSAAGNLANISTKWSNRLTGTQVFRVEERYRIPVTVAVPVTFSVYLKGSTTLSGSIVIDWYNQAGAQIGSSSTVTTSITTSWQRFQVTGTPPVGTVTARGAFLTSATAPDVYLAAAQFEEASTASAWKIGGGCPVVLIDQLETSTPRFPYRNTTLTILEA